MNTPLQAAFMGASFTVIAATLNKGTAAVFDLGWWSAVAVVAAAFALWVWHDKRKPKP